MKISFPNFLSILTIITVSVILSFGSTACNNTPDTGSSSDSSFWNDDSLIHIDSSGYVDSVYYSEDSTIGIRLSGWPDGKPPITVINSETFQIGFTDSLGKRIRPKFDDTLVFKPMVIGDFGYEIRNGVLRYYISGNDTIWSRHD